MAIKVKVSIRQDEVQWTGSDLIVPFVVEPQGFPAQGGSFVIAAGGLNAAQLAGQFKTQLLTWIEDNPEYDALGSVTQTELVLIGGFS
jgi:hypothetical protein